MKRKMTELGMGLLLDRIRFHANVIKYPHGFGVTRQMRIQIRFKESSPMQREVMRMWCNEEGLPHETLYIKRKVDIRAWIEALAPFSSLLTDEINYHKLIYLLDNPIPKASSPKSTWPMFYKWVEEWDEYCEEIEFSL